MRHVSVSRTPFFLVLIVLLLAAALVISGLAAAQTRSLSGSVGPGFTISLNSKGKKARSVSAGRYRITVRDRSDFHNFHLRGPGVNRRITTVDFVGTRSRTFRLRRGTYRYLCDPHSDSMKGSFRVR